MKRIYDDEDVITIYFVISKDDRGNKKIQGWTDEKECALSYMKFHKCKDFKITKRTSTFGKMIQLINENNNDEISLYNIETKSRHHKKYEPETTLMVVPMTETERIFVNEECKTLLATRIDYNYINNAIDFLKNKYIKVLEKIFLKDAMKKVIHNQQSVIDNFKLDELLILYYSFPENFGM